MSRRREETAMDYANKKWAEQRRKALGIILPKKFNLHEMLGIMRGTLSQVREEGEGASYGVAKQHFPEVYTGDALIVHIARQDMTGPQKLVHHVHYVFWEMPYKLKAKECEMTEPVYGSHLKALNLYLKGYFAAHDRREHMLTDRHAQMA